jgi:hypothetical protein
MGPEDNPADDVQPTKEEWEAWERRKAFTCKVCGNWPDETGELEHGRGCYTQSADGGGSEFFDLTVDAYLKREAK